MSETDDTPIIDEAPVVESEATAVEAGTGEVTDVAVMSTDDMLRQIIADQASARSENQALREELAKARMAPPPAPSSAALSPEEAARKRQDELRDYEFYCPGCGALSHYPRACTGRGEAPHPAIEVVSTEEIKGANATDAEKHTAAPGVAP